MIQHVVMVVYLPLNGIIEPLLHDSETGVHEVGGLRGCDIKTGVSPGYFPG
jgi:hypothetical protein